MSDVPFFEPTKPETPDPGAEAKERIKGIYAEVEQKGLDPANRPRGVPEGERDPHKTVPDLEDITGNPGHRGINPNAPDWLMHPNTGVLASGTGAISSGTGTPADPPPQEPPPEE